MIYFCIPSHNEAATVGLVLWKLRRVLEESAREYQLLVGDDASTDATAEALAPYLKALPLTVLYIQTGLDDTLFGLAMVHTMLAMPFAVLITFSLFSGVPVELEEAAWVFACNKAQAFQKVVLPLALPGLTAGALEALESQLDYYLKHPESGVAWEELRAQRE